MGHGCMPVQEPARTPIKTLLRGATSLRGSCKLLQKDKGKDAAQGQNYDNSRNGIDGIDSPALT